MKKGARLIAYVLLNQAIEKPFIVEVLLKHVKVEVEAKEMLKETEGISGVGTSVVSE